MTKNKRAIIQWALLPLVFIVIGVGWKYPLLGLIVPIVIIAALITSIYKGRYFCGTFCPRGAFYDRFVVYFSPKRSIPKFFRSMKFRIFIILLFSASLIIQLHHNFFSINHWAQVFWTLCFLTTAFGIALALLIHPRTWCAFCPVGTLQNLIGGKKQTLKIKKENCAQCRLCEKKCPMDLPILDNKATEMKDCLKCEECVNACPKKVIHID